MTRTARLKAFGKLNIGLRVLYKRPDGFHELRTVFQSISLADRIGISFTRSRRTRIEIQGAQIPDNIMVRAAARILDEIKLTASVHFNLAKNIPAGSGLGGGSSDAAAVLIALPVLAGRNVSPDVLARIAGELGSDVPFFLYGGTALGIGRGEELYPLPSVARGSAIIIAPVIHSSTVEAYRDLSGALGPPEPKLALFQAHTWNPNLPDSTNDFEAPVFARHPELKRLRDRLRKLGAPAAAMTGSGSAIFGIFENPAQRAAALKAFPDEQTHAVSFLSRAQYQGAWKRALQPHTKGDLWPPQSLYAR